MPSSKLVLGGILGVLGLVIAGCGMYVGGVFGGPAYAYDHPRYCYDCHRYPQWEAGVVDCDYYDFYFVSGGYYYMPRHATTRIYMHRKYNWGQDKKFVTYYDGHRLGDDDRVRIEKEYRGVDKGERKRIEREYKDYDKRVRGKPEKAQGREEKGKR